ncbi:putative baseplate assembly protein [Streptomyces inusitatus]|uniref:Baseplate assembly protein n=1 Tax=Streptomyces inusitatus TaxID=68221 RepID=A0A918QCN6_9ACTN|nr:putative baseplate assembly protein [Streptomyces inusitatus]GGZ39962.1 putative baseplate assembly protein [Streptomyces inusitatus]
MTLPAPKLDDLTWDAIMAESRRRVPAESDGLWTLHAPADPGITLLELFAHLLEQRLYWLDQVPDALVVALLRLLGVDPPRPARAAATVLHLIVPTDPGAPVPVVRAGTPLSRDPLGRVVFTLDDEVAAFPLDPDGEITAVTDRDRTADLRARRGVPLLASDGGPSSARFTLPLTGELPAPGPLSLLVEVDAPAAVTPEWLPGATDGVPPPAELNWSWFRPGTDRGGAFGKVEDGTAGLRRSGVVRLHPPPGWTTRDSGLLLSTPAATFTAPPRLLRLAVNACAARHLRRHTLTGAVLAQQIEAWLKLPGQRLVLPEAADGLLDAALSLADEEWSAAPDFTFGASADRIFVVDRAEGALVFGDGLTGRVPRPDARNARADYTTGGGRAGNGGLTANWLPADDSAPAALTATSLVQASGGQDPETVPEARRRAAAALGEVTRAVTAEDFVTLARTTPGVAVARAHPAVGEHPGHPCATVPGAVTLHIVPSAPRDDLTREDFVPDPRPDPGLLCAVAARLDRARLLTSEVFVRPPDYRDVTLRVDLSGDPADRARASAAAADGLRRYLDPLIGGEDGEGWPFGEPLRPSALLRAAQRALGDLADVLAVAIGLDGDEPDESCRDVRLRAGDLPVLRAVRTRVVPAAEPGEGLT